MAKRKKAPSTGSKLASSPEDAGFDAQLLRLEALVAELEGGDLVLEDAMERFGEGVRLLGQLRASLSGFEERVEELSTEAEEGLSEMRRDDQGE